MRLIKSLCGLPFSPGLWHHKTQNSDMARELRVSAVEHTPDLSLVHFVPGKTAFLYFFVCLRAPGERNGYQLSSDPPRRTNIFGVPEVRIPVGRSPLCFVSNSYITPSPSGVCLARGVCLVICFCMFYKGRGRLPLPGQQQQQLQQAA
jgi:hypothetical protein